MSLEIAESPQEHSEDDFSQLPFTPTIPTSPRLLGRATKLILTALALIVAFGFLLAYHSRSAGVAESHSPRVVVDVEGLHCPIQCGLKVASQLEKLPGVIPKTVSANPKTGLVIFQVERFDSVSREEVEQAILRAGFTVRSVQLPAHTE